MKYDVNICMLLKQKQCLALSVLFYNLEHAFPLLYTYLLHPKAKHGGGFLAIQNHIMRTLYVPTDVNYV